MPSQIDTAKLVNTIVETYNVAELEGFLSDYFDLRLEVIINPTGIGFDKVVRSVVEYFNRRGNLTDLLRELGKDRPGKVYLPDLFLPPSSVGTSGFSASGVGIPLSTGLVEIESDEVDFCFLIEPDRRVVPVKVGKGTINEAIYVRIPVIGGSSAHQTGLPLAFSLALDRSGSMQGQKIEVARAAADFILDIATSPMHQVAILAFDDQIETIVSMQQVKDPRLPKAALRRVAPRGQTDLFKAWEQSVRSLRTFDRTWDRRAVLITDGQLNCGMVDSKRFSDEVARAWQTEGIATSCISMGDDWNVDLLNGLASCGGGTIQFINDVAQAIQALHEAFHMRHGTVACNIHANIQVLGTAQVTQVQGIPCSLKGGQKESYHLANHLRTNVEEELVLRIEFAAPRSGETLELLTCSFSYETPTGEQRQSIEKTLRVIGEEVGYESGKLIVNQGVVSAAHSMMAHHCFREALTGFLHGEAALGSEMLERAKICLYSAPTPRAYRAHMEMCDQRINDLAQFQGRVPIEYIKQKYIDELSHKDVVWIGLCQILDRVRYNLNDAMGNRQAWNTHEVFDWASDWVSKFSIYLPIQADVRDAEARTHVYSEERLLQEGQREDSRSFWQSKAGIAHQNSTNERGHNDWSTWENRPPILVAVAGACCAFESWRQGTRQELVEVMDSYWKVIERDVDQQRQ